MDGALAAKRHVLERFDTFAEFRNKVRHIASAVGEWAGIPTPLPGQPMVLDPSYPIAKFFQDIDYARQPQREIDLKDGQRIRNRWYSFRERGVVWVWEEDGKINHLVARSGLATGMLINTIGASYAWGVEQESKAVQTLGTLVRHHTFKQYLLTGSFMETSKRSGITYIFRRLRPTVAITMKPRPISGHFPPFREPDDDADTPRVLCTLCMHPIGYYDGTWGGAMCPTDDVIAHLMLMRGDEHMFWRRCNQHPAWMPQSGLGA